MNFRTFALASLTFLLSVPVSFVSMAQKGTGCPDDLVPKYSENRNWGYADLFGTWVIEPIYSKVSPFVEGKAVVQRGILCGVIDCQGNVILQCKYEKLTPFRNGKVWAMEKGVWGLIGAKGQVFQAPQFSEINPIINSELCWVKKNNVWGLFNEDKNSFICQPQFKIAQVMSYNASLVQIDKVFGVLNHVNCGYLLPLELTRVKKLAPHDIMYELKGKWGVFNDEGKIILNPEYDTIFLKEAELLQVTKDGKMGLYGLRGKKLMDVAYDEISPLQEGFYTVKQNGKYGYANRAGRVLIKANYDEAKPFSNKKAAVKKGEKWGIIDYLGKYILKPEYEYIEGGKGPFFSVKENGKFFFYGSDAKKINSEGFEKIEIQDTVYAVRVKKENKFSYYNPGAKSYVTPQWFDAAGPYENGFALVRNNGKKGMLDVNGKQIFACQYDEITYDLFQNKIVFRTLMNGKEGVADMTGKVILANEYDQIIPALPNYLKVLKDGKYAILRTNGTAVTEFIYESMSNVSSMPTAPEWPSLVSHKGKFGLINEKGEEVYPVKAKELKYLGSNLYAAKEGKIWVLINISGKTVELNYQEIGNFGDAMAAVKQDNKWGYIYYTGEDKIKPLYEQAELFANRMGAVKLKGKWGIIDRNGKTVVPFEYDSYSVDAKGNRILYKAGKEYFLQSDGSLK